MDSIYVDDPSLPVNFDESGKFTGLPDVTTGSDITANNFGEHFPGPSSTTGGPKMSSGSGRMSPARAHTMKDYEQQISDLKKENFSLKLRIYFMEEKIQQKFEDDDNIKTNIELKVETENLKKEVMDKQQLLLRASQAVESLALEKEQILKKQDKGIEKRYEVKLRTVEEENIALKEGNDDLQNQLDQARELQEDLQKAVCDKSSEQQNLTINSKETLAEKDRIINQLNAAMNTKDQLISNLTEEKQQVYEGTINPMRQEQNQLLTKLQNNQIDFEKLKQDLEKEQLKAEREFQKQIAEHTDKMKQLQETLKQTQSELEGKDGHLKDLENNLRDSQQTEKESADVLRHKEVDIQSLESNSLKRDKAIQGFVQALRGKEKEVDHLYNQLEEKERELSQAREAMHKAEMKKYEGIEQYQSSMSECELKVEDLKADLHSKQLENERLQKSDSYKQQQLDRIQNEKTQIKDQGEMVLAEKEGAIQNLQRELQEAGKSRELNDIKDNYQNRLDDHKTELAKKDDIIQKLTKSVQDKDEFMESQVSESEDILEQMKSVLKEKQTKLERQVEEKVLAAEDAEGDAADLRKLLKDKELDLKLLQEANQKQIQKCNYVENKLKAASSKNRQLTEALNIASKSKEIQTDGLKQSLAEKDGLMSHLQIAVSEKEGIIENLQDLLQGQTKGETTKADLFQKLTAKLKDKEKQFQELAAERADVARDNDKATQDLLDALRDKDNQIDDCNAKLKKESFQYNNKIRTLQRDLENKEFELQGGRDDLSKTEKGQEHLLGKVRNAVEEKDKLIEKLLDSGREKDKLFAEMQQAKSHPPSQIIASEMKRLKNEIDSLQSALSAKEDEMKKLKSSIPEKVDHLKSDLQIKNKLLERAKATIEHLRQHPIEARPTRNVDETANTSPKQCQLDAMAEELKAKDQLIKVLVSDFIVKDDSTGSKLLAAIQSLGHQLEKNVHRRDEICINVDGRPYFSSSTSGVGSDMHDASAGTSTNTNDGLAGKLRDLTNREVQTNGNDDLSSVASAESVSGRRRHTNVTDMTVPELQGEPTDLRDELAESAEELQRAPENRLEREDFDGSLRSIPGQEDDSDTNSSAALRQRIGSLECQVQRGRQESDSLRQQLEATLLNRSKDGADSASHVIPILKQQLDQAKTLLREKDATLRDKEQDNQNLRHRLRNGSDLSHCTTTLQQENARLKQLQQDLLAKLNEASDQVTLFEAQNGKLQDINEGLIKKLDAHNANTPQLQSQLERSNSLIRKKERENIALREKLGIGPKDDFDSGRTKVDHLEGANAILKEQLQDITSRSDHLKQELGVALAKLDVLRDSRHEQQTPEINNLRKKLKTAENMNGLLKRHIELNTTEEGSAAQFNPELIVDLAQEIERLQGKLRKVGIEVRSSDEKDSKKTRSKERTGSEDAIKTLEEQLVNCQRELREYTQRNMALQRKVRATEGTVHQQADRIQRYRRQLHNHGLDPAGSPKRVQSESNLLRPGISCDQLYGATDKSSSEQYLAAGDLFGASFSEFGNSDDIFELREQVEVLKTQNERYKRTVKSLQHRLRSGSNSRSSSPSRSLSPDQDKSAWFEVVANQGAFVRLQEEVTNLKSQLEEANNMNHTLHEQYKDIQSKIEDIETIPENKQHDQQIRERDKEIILLRNYLDESKCLCDLMKTMLLDALKIMEDIKGTEDWFSGNVGEDVGKQYELMMEKLQKGTDIADTLYKALDEPSVSSNDSTNSRRMSTFAESLKEKLNEISILQNDVAKGRRTNHSLRKLLTDNQKVAEDARKELEKLGQEICGKQETIRMLEQQLDRALKINNAHSAAHQLREKRRGTVSKSVALQTDLRETVCGQQEAPDLSQLHSKLRENQLLVSTLKSELDIYRNVLHSKTPEGSPHSKKTGHTRLRRDHSDETLKEYLEELRALRKKLEESIWVNDKLRKQLETKLAQFSKETGDVTIIHLQETNIQLTETVQTLTAKLTEKDHLNQTMKDNLKHSQREFIRLQSENQKLSEQLVETLDLQNSLRFELSVYETMHPTDSPQGQSSNGGRSFPTIKDPNTGMDLSELLKEMRHLRIQLERSIDTNNALRTKLEEMMNDKRWSPPKVNKISVRKKTESQNSNLSRRLFTNSEGVNRKEGERNQDLLTDFSPYEDPQFYEMPVGLRSPHQQIGSDNSPPTKDGEYFAIGTLLTFERLKKTLGECRAVLKVFETLLGEQKRSQLQDNTKMNILQQLHSLVHKASILIEESSVHLAKFTTARLPKKDEVSRLKRQLLAQQKLLKDTLSHLSASNRFKDDIEEAIVNDLMQHEETLVRAHRNLETKRLSGASSHH